MDNNVLNGKAIFRADKKQQVITHNKAIVDHAITTPFILLHFKNRNIEERIRNQINYCISMNYINRNTPEQDYITILEPLLEKNIKQTHPLKEVISYFKNKSKHIKSRYSYDKNNVLRTNVVDHALSDNPLTYRFTSENYNSLDDAIDKTFQICKQRWKKTGVSFASRVSFLKSLWCKFQKNNNNNNK